MARPTMPRVGHFDAYPRIVPRTAAAIRRIRYEDAALISDAFGALGWPGKTVEQFERYAREDAEGSRTCFVAEADGQIAGYCTLLWESTYPHFRAADIPEISDLNVLPSHRNLGVGNLLLDAVERAASERSDSVGLGVGLYADYGPAQRIYARRGYVPDGRGLMYDYAPVQPGAKIQVDDAATLMLVLAL